VAGSPLAAAIAEAHRREWAFVLAATVRVTRDLDLAEECVQDAYARALESWARSGIPERPGAWLTTVARRRALDLRRRSARLARSLPLLLDDPYEPEEEPPHEVTDDRLRLIFTCCHPALAPDAQVALTLRLVCGLSTTEVARAFLVSETTMAARITRAKKKIAAARIPYRVPGAEELPARTDAVLSVVHLVFTTGHTAPAGDRLVRQDLVERALDLARMLRSLLASDREVAGLLALILLTNARSATRVSAEGELLLLADQDRARWDHLLVQRGLAGLRRAEELSGALGPYTLQAAIAACHARARSVQETDWPRIVALYDALAALTGSPVVELNRAVAVTMAFGPEAGLDLIDSLAGEPALRGYHLLPSVRGDVLVRLGRLVEAREEFERAADLCENQRERELLLSRAVACDAHGPL
jgi:RNA polymerase sigma factor (sigma-70 family)